MGLLVLLLLLALCFGPSNSDAFPTSQSHLSTRAGCSGSQAAASGWFVLALALGFGGCGCAVVVVVVVFASRF